VNYDLSVRQQLQLALRLMMLRASAWPGVAVLRAHFRGIFEFDASLSLFLDSWYPGLRIMNSGISDIKLGHTSYKGK